ncbi:MAG: nucleotide exchange factor GrpE [Myxococcales bacterium]
MQRREEEKAQQNQAASAADAEQLQKLREDLLKARQDLRQREAELEASQAMGRETTARLKDQHERTLRAAADLENFRKRAQKEKEELQRFGQERLLKDVLPVLDNLDRALEHAKSPADFEGLKTGLQMTRKLFEDTLARFGVKGFSSLNQPFDPHLHEAMQSVESDAPPNTVVAELVRGYTLNERLMRPAMVVVSKARAPSPAADAAPAAAREDGTPPAAAAEGAGSEAPEAAQARVRDQGE